MKNYKKYQRQYFPIVNPSMDWTKKEYIDKAPVWCSVDLRDGNQSLAVPMTLEQKIEFFKLLVKIGFKEIEIGFPAASETEFAFARKLIEENLIPDDVSIQVLTQAREAIIAKTFEAVRGARSAIVHVYNSTSRAQREQVFKKSKQQIVDIAVNGAKLLKEYAEKTEGNFRFEYSPESFTGTEPEFALEICNAVLDVWQPASDKKAIINLPATVEHSMPHVFASTIEWMSKNIKYRENVQISLHNHNDRGTGVAATEMGILAGADRVEGTLFGNGERTGNADLVTLALNLYSQGVDPNLDFSNMSGIVELYERVTQMKVYERSAYAGSLVFCAFSGSHQDAIAKSFKWHEDTNAQTWTVPYLPINPSDVGRELETCTIRINSQSGKGGIGYILEQNGYNLPAKMREIVGYSIKGISDKQNKELTPKEVIEGFKRKFVDIVKPITLVKCNFTNGGKEYTATLEIKYDGGKSLALTGKGNGRLDAVANALTTHLGFGIEDLDYSEHSLGKDSQAQAISYISIKVGGIYYYGVGIDSDIMLSSIKALVSAINRCVELRKQGD